MTEFEQCDSYGPTDQGAEHEAQRCYLRAGHESNGGIHQACDGQMWRNDQEQPRGPLPVDQQCGDTYADAPGVRPDSVYYCRLPAGHGGKLHHGHRPNRAGLSHWQTEAVWPVETPTVQLDAVAGTSDDELIRIEAMHAAVRYYAIDGVTALLGNLTPVFERYIRTGTWPEAWQ